MSDTTEFNRVFERIIKHEGGYVNHPADPGGETNFGITKRTAMAYGYTSPMRNMTRADARRIYEKAFYSRYKTWDFPPVLLFQIFDAAVNHGHGNACRMLQRAVGVLDDGVWGDVSQQALNAMSSDDVVVRFIGERLRFYTRLKHFDTFGRGWINRMAENLYYVAEDNGV